MPMQINVYEEDEQVYVTWMNMRLMGKMFGNKVAEVMAKAADMLMSVHKDIIEKEES